MLRSFRVENHKSIRDEQELVLLPAYDKTRPTVPVAAVFGANASGKSNLLDALIWMRDAVLNSFAAWQPGSGVPRRPFLLDPAAAEKTSGYCVEINVDDERYMYGVEVDDDRVRQEWLYAYPHGRRRVIFDRDGDRVRLGSTVQDYRSRGESLRRQTRANALFLTVAALNDVAEVQPIYQWFRTALAFGDSDAVLSEDLVRRLQDDADAAALISLIQAADLGIQNVMVEPAHDLAALREQLAAAEAALAEARSSRDAAGAAFDHPLVKPKDAPVHLAKLEAASERAAQAAYEAGRLTAQLDHAASGAMRLAFHHQGGTVPLRLGDESAGTRSWIALVSHMLRVLDIGGVLVIDEVDASLHPHLTARLINLFRNEETNPRRAQILFTTHDSTLLDDGVLSRDEIWFVEKATDTGATKLYPLTDFYPRKNEDTEGRYLAGSYGAVPVLTDYDFREAVRRRWGDVEAA